MWEQDLLVTSLNTRWSSTHHICYRWLSILYDIWLFCGKRMSNADFFSSVLSNVDWLICYRYRYTSFHRMMIMGVYCQFPRHINDIMGISFNGGESHMLSITHWWSQFRNTIYIHHPWGLHSWIIHEEFESNLISSNILFYSQSNHRFF